MELREPLLAWIYYAPFMIPKVFGVTIIYQRDIHTGGILVGHIAVA